MVKRSNNIAQKRLPTGFGKPFFILCCLLVIIFSSSCLDLKEQMGKKSLTTVDHVDLNRYLGKWYEIARYPNRFQKGCVGSRATYSLRDDGKISVLNECYEEGTDKLRQAKGKAWIVDKKTNAKLKVSFFWPFSGDYWIIELGKDYDYVVIGHPDRKYLWILSRTREMRDELYNDILARLKLFGYDPSLLIKNDLYRRNDET